jgi:hypothetical protein
MKMEARHNLPASPTAVPIRGGNVICRRGLDLQQPDRRRLSA